MAGPREWLTEEEASEWLGVPLTAVKAAVQAGELPALKVAGHVRINRDATLSFTGGRVAPRQATEPAAAEVADVAGGVPVPAGLAWLEELTPTEGFVHGWPKVGGGKDPEDYPQAWQGRIRVHGRDIRVKVGEAVRYERGRLTVFFNGTPICEFMDTHDGTGWASVIKPEGKAALAVGEAPPPLYRTARVESYRDVTNFVRKGVPNGAAVVVDRDDRRSAVHHAVARWLGRNRYPVESAS